MGGQRLLARTVTQPRLASKTAANLTARRFQYLFLNVVENPAARVKPPNVDELQWREAMQRRVAAS